MNIGLVQLIHEEEHKAPAPHPENPGRMKSALEYVLRSDISEKIENLGPGKVDESAIHKIHFPDYIQYLKKVSDVGGGFLDSDTYISGGSYEAAMTTARAAIGAADAIMEKRYNAIFLAGRPPGHHAEQDRGMGFCLINNAAVAAEHLVKNHGLKKVAIVDWDLHHGNGTQHIFYNRSDVFYISLHQYPYYPGSGGASETGKEEGEGFTLNLPMPGAADHDRWMTEFNDFVVSALDKYQPEFIIISAGFDGHKDDPLGGLNLTERTYGEMTQALKVISKKYGEGRILSLFEGGYDPKANGLSLYEHLKELQKDNG